MSGRVSRSTESKRYNPQTESWLAPGSCRRFILAAALATTSLFGNVLSGYAQSPGVAQTPYLGWSSWSQQTISSNFLTQAKVAAQSDALLASGLQSHGFNYINMDSGWHGGFDANGRPLPNLTTFPDIVALVAHIHENGQKAGIYWIPGVEQPAVAANSPILGTIYHIKDILAVPYTAGNAFGAAGTSPYHYKIDFTKPGAQEYVNSVVDLFASWGIDSIKLDAVTPGSTSNSLHIDNRADVEAWAKAIAQNGRPIWFTISWALDKDYLSTWQQYANARRIEGDIDCEGNCSTITNWAMASWRFYDLVGWQNDAGAEVGWNDLDSLEATNSTTSGLSYEERQSVTTLWAMANAPMYLGGDLTTLDDFGKQILTNDEVIAVNQSGHPAKQAVGGLVDSDYLIIGQNLFAEIVQGCQVASQIHRRVRHRPQRGHGLALLVAQARGSAVGGLERIQVIPADCGASVVLPSHKIVKAPRSHSPVRNRGAVALAIDVAFDPARIRVLLPRAEVIFIQGPGDGEPDRTSILRDRLRPGFHIRSIVDVEAIAGGARGHGIELDRVNAPRSE